MERLLVNLLVAAALERMDRTHRKSYRGKIIKQKTAKKVEACRKFLNWIEGGAS